MAKQNGIIKIKGTIGDLTFYRSKDGHLVRENNPITAERIASDPAFIRTRENGQEFGRAGKAGKILRDAIKPLLQLAQDRLVVSRLTKAMMKVVKADATSTRGKRNVIDGELELLLGFDFNLDAKFSATLYAPSTATIDRVTGDAVFTVPSFKPSVMIAAPGGATHFKIVSMAAEIDFEKMLYVAHSQTTAALPWDENATAIITQTHSLPANSTHPLILLAGVQFLQQVNNELYPLKNGAFNALNMVQIKGV